VCSVDLSESLGELASVGTVNADAYNNFAYVDGELISFAYATAQANNIWTLNDSTLGIYVRRGLFASNPTTHATGAAFAYLGNPKFPDASVAIIAYPPDMTGHALHFKFTPYNTQEGNEQTDLSVAVDYLYTPTGTPTQVISTPVVSVWQPDTAYLVGDYVTPSNGYAYLATVGGTSGSTQPAFPLTYWASVHDGPDIVWKNVGAGVIA